MWFRHFSVRVREVGRQPAQRADQLEVAVPEDLQMILGQCERGKKLVAGGACEQIIVPDHAKVSLTALNADLETETTVLVTVDFTGAQELNETILQAAADVVAELAGILVAALACARADHEVALSDHPAAIQTFQDCHPGVFPENVPIAVRQQRRSPAGDGHLQNSRCRP